MAGLTQTALLLITFVALPCSLACADDPLDGILDAWVDEAREVERPTVDIAQARYGQELSMHQLEAAVALWSPDSLESLTSRFAWSITAGTQSAFWLTGVPVSEVDRAFIGTVEVLWDAEARRPASIRFVGGDVH